jgi:dihydroflavonol-4-reductase
MDSSLASKSILVTGVSGFIGLHTALHLLQYGYRVRGTIRTELLEKNAREALSKYCDTSQLEFARTDLLKDDGWMEAVHGCDFVIHTASPFPAENPKNENELIIPAVEGTLRVLRAAQTAGIKRFVMLSTSGAIFDGHQGENRTFDESDWTDLWKTRLIYHKSKTLAERAAWDFVHSAENKSKMEMVAVNPTSVFGPVLDSHHHTSAEWYRTIMHAEVPGVSRTQLNFIDVRDLVDILEKAMTVPEAADKRFLCNGASIALLEFADILHQNFSNRGYRIINRILPDPVIRFFAIFIPKVRSVADTLGWKYSLSTEQARSVFGWQPRPYKQTIIDMAESLIKYGLV